MVERSPMILTDGAIPMRWWDHRRNFGDLLGPWLVEKMAGRPVKWVPRHQPHYVTIGSILGHVQPSSVVWGTGSFGNEGKTDVTNGNRYLATRGPLTRARLEMFKQPCPRVYGDPALLVPEFHPAQDEKEYELGVILRWSERKRKRAFNVAGVRLIDLETDGIEATLDAITSCQRIISTSLHGLILADAYGIPNAWLIAETGYGKEHKFWDYLISVRKEREPADFDITDDSLTAAQLSERMIFDDRKIQLDLETLKQTSPFWNTTPEVREAENTALEGADFMKSTGKIDTSSIRPKYEF